MNEPIPRFRVEPDANSHFSWVRTQLALQSTLMAAIRTGVSLIGFGFTVAQFFRKLMEDVPAGLQQLNPAAPRNFGLLLIATGVVSVAVFTWQYRRAVTYLSQPPYDTIAIEHRLYTSIYLMAFAVMFIGVAGFASVLLRF